MATKTTKATVGTVLTPEEVLTLYLILSADSSNFRQYLAGKAGLNGGARARKPNNRPKAAKMFISYAKTVLGIDLSDREGDVQILFTETGDLEREGIEKIHRNLGPYPGGGPCPGGGGEQWIAQHFIALPAKG